MITHEFFNYCRTWSVLQLQPDGLFRVQSDGRTWNRRSSAAVLEHTCIQWNLNPTRHSSGCLCVCSRHCSATVVPFTHAHTHNARLTRHYDMQHHNCFPTIILFSRSSQVQILRDIEIWRHALITYRQKTFNDHVHLRINRLFLENSFKYCHFFVKHVFQLVRVLLKIYFLTRFLVRYLVWKTVCQWSEGHQIHPQHLQHPRIIIISRYQRVLFWFIRVVLSFTGEIYKLNWIFMNSSLLDDIMKEQLSSLPLRSWSLMSSLTLWPFSPLTPAQRTKNTETQNGGECDCFVAVQQRAAEGPPVTQREAAFSHSVGRTAHVGRTAGGAELLG